MTDNILRQATQAEVDALNAGRTFAGQTRTTVFGSNPNAKAYFVGFEGTRNNQNDPSKGPITNVAVLTNQANKAFEQSGGQAEYYPGPGTQGALQFLDLGFGSTIPFAARAATDGFQLWAQKQFESNPNTEINLAGASFSRGTITHTVFLNTAYSEGVGKRGTEFFGNPSEPTQITGYSAYWI